MLWAYHNGTILFLVDDTGNVEGCHVRVVKGKGSKEWSRYSQDEADLNYKYNNIVMFQEYRITGTSQKNCHKP